MANAYLKMRAWYTLGYPIEERRHYFRKFDWLDYIEYFLDFIEEHDLFRAVHLGPVAQQTSDDLCIY